MRALAGSHPGFRPVHAKGIVCSGTFRGAPTARKLRPFLSEVRGRLRDGASDHRSRRGGGDFYASRDLEDIVAVVDGRPSLIEEIKSAPSDLRNYIAREIGKLLASPQFAYAIA